MSLNRDQMKGKMLDLAWDHSADGNDAAVTEGREPPSHRSDPCRGVDGKHG